MKLNFGHCVGCDQPIRPPYLSFTVMWAHGDGNSVAEWEEVDVCATCAVSLTANDLHRLVDADEDDASADRSPEGQDAQRLDRNDESAVRQTPKLNRPSHE